MTKTEERILKVWQEVFGREDFGIDDDFFELGGNSLMAMRIYMKLSEEVNLLVGTVQEVVPEQSGKSSSAVILPGADPRTVKHVFIVTEY